MFLYYFLTFFSFSYSQSTVFIGIIDNQNYSKNVLNINIPNITFCNQYGVTLQIQWINPSHALPNLVDQLDLHYNNQTIIYLARTAKQYSTKLIQDYCQIKRIPFISIQSYENSMKSSTYEYLVMPNVLRVLMSYLKYYHVRRAAYIYDNDEATHRLYELFELMNSDDYFNNFSLDIRSTQHQDVYSLLYSIEIHSTTKDQSPKYILLDFQSYSDYQMILDKISHMGLTSDLYHYIIVANFDACLWTKKIYFTGQLIYFDYQQRDCALDYETSIYSDIKLKSSSKTKESASYYRSKLSFRSEPNKYKSLNSTESLELYSSLSNKSDDGDSRVKLNSCYNNINSSEEYFSYKYFISHLVDSYQLHYRSLYDVLHTAIRILDSPVIDCKTFRLKRTKKNYIYNKSHDFYVYTTKKTRSHNAREKIELIGKYSSTSGKYQTCHIDERKESSRIESTLTSKASAKIYYITSLFDEPFLMLRKRTDLHAKYSHPNADLKELRGRIFELNELEGFCVDLAVKVCSILNIICKFRIVQDGTFGSKNVSTGLWNGMVGEVVSHLADMAIAPLTISQQRMEVVDFSKPFMNLGISIMIRKPDAQKPGVFSFMNPVSMEIWLCFSLAYFAVSVVLFLTSRVVNSGWQRRVVRQPSYRSYAYAKPIADKRTTEGKVQQRKQNSNEHHNSLNLPARRRHHNRARHHSRMALGDEIRRKRQKGAEIKQKDIHLFGISNALFFSFASFMRQSINLVPKSFSGRIAATSWWYFSLIFVSSYTANLVAFLTVEKLVTPIESVEDLAKQHEIKYGSLRNGTTSAFFEKSNVSVFQHMWSMMQKMSTDVFVTTNDEGVAKVRSSKGKYAFFIESTKNEYVNERLPCDTMQVGSNLDSKGYGIPTRLGSDLTEAINIIITNLRESGFLDKLKQRWWYERSECTQSVKDKRFSQLSLSSVTGLFYIFLFGIMLSCVIAFTEFLITAKAESEKLHVEFREILRIKMIENLVGMTINAQRHFEFGRVESACNYHYGNEEEDSNEYYIHYQFNKQQSDV